MLLVLLDNPEFRTDLGKVLKHEVSTAELRDLKANLPQKIEFVPKRLRKFVRKSEHFQRFLILIEKAYQRGDIEVYSRVKYFFIALLKNTEERKKFK